MNNIFLDDFYSNKHTFIKDGVVCLGALKEWRKHIYEFFAGGLHNISIAVNHPVYDEILYRVVSKHNVSMNSARDFYYPPENTVSLGRINQDAKTGLYVSNFPVVSVEEKRIKQGDEFYLAKYKLDDAYVDLVGFGFSTQTQFETIDGSIEYYWKRTEGLLKRGLSLKGLSESLFEEKISPMIQFMDLLLSDSLQDMIMLSEQERYKITAIMTESFVNAGIVIIYPTVKKSCGAVNYYFPKDQADKCLSLISVEKYFLNKKPNLPNSNLANARCLLSSAFAECSTLVQKANINGSNVIW